MLRSTSFIAGVGFLSFSFLFACGGGQDDDVTPAAETAAITGSGASETQFPGAAIISTDRGFCPASF